MLTGIDWLGINKNFLYKVIIYYIDLLIKKLKGDEISLVNEMKQYLTVHIDEIIFPEGYTKVISQNIIAGMLHERGTFNNIGFDPRFEITWKNKEIQTALNELEEFKTHYVSLVKKDAPLKGISNVHREIISKIPNNKATLVLKNNGALKILTFLKKEINVYQNQ